MKRKGKEFNQIILKCSLPYCYLALNFNPKDGSISMFINFYRQDFKWIEKWIESLFSVGETTSS